jgi:predicted DNA-binding transcriptional regulator AlpA
MRIVTFKELGPLYGIWFCRSTIRRKIDPKSPWYDPDFPTPVARGPRFIGFRDYELEAYNAGLKKKQLAVLPPEHEEPPLGELPLPIEDLDYTN